MLHIVQTFNVICYRPKLCIVTLSNKGILIKLLYKCLLFTNFIVCHLNYKDNFIAQNPDYQIIEKSFVFSDYTDNKSLFAT